MTQALIAAVQDIVVRLREGRFPNEQAISQGIVLRLLQILGWEPWDPGVVWPEYQTGEGRADFALCHPIGKPIAFVEVKQPGKADEGVRQSLEYAFHTGVPFVVLTDGQTWSFYLPAEQGTYEDRRIYHLNIRQRSSQESAEALSRYLARTGWEAGETIERVRQEYRNRSRRQQARAALDGAWDGLLCEGNSGLIEILSGAVEARIGFRPDEEDVGEFLAGLSVRDRAPRPASPGSCSPSPTPSVRGPMVAAQTASTAAPTPGPEGAAMLLGQRLPARNAMAELVVILQALADADATFLSRCYRHPENHGRRRVYITQDPDELYPGRPDLAALRQTIRGTWVVASNISNQTKTKIMRMACDVARLVPGRDVRASFLDEGTGR